MKVLGDMLTLRCPQGYSVSKKQHEEIYMSVNLNRKFWDGNI